MPGEPPAWTHAGVIVQHDPVPRTNVMGEGPPIVLAHGMLGPAVWAGVAERLAARFQVIVPTFPGFLPEDRVFEYRDETYVEFLEALRCSLGIGRWAVVGYSMGGRTVLNYATRHSDRVSHLAVIDGAGVRDASRLLRVPGLPRLAAWVAERVAAPQIRAFVALAEAADRRGPVALQMLSWYLAMTESRTVRANLARMVMRIARRKAEWADELPRLRIPTLILWCERDRICPLANAGELNALIQDSRLVVLERHGHLGVIERPEFFADHIAQFVEHGAAEPFPVSPQRPADGSG